MRGVRHNEELGWFGQCDKCRQWWPLDFESWRPKMGLRTCYACHKEDRRAYLARLRAEQPEMRARHREASAENQKLKRTLDREAFLEYQRRWYAANHVRLNAERAEKYAIECELAGRPQRRRSSRDETPETLRYRAEYRKKWEQKTGISLADIRQRVRNREWMRRHRQENAA